MSVNGAVAQACSCPHYPVGEVSVTLSIAFVYGRHLKGGECTGSPDSTGPGMGSRSTSGTWGGTATSVETKAGKQALPLPP